MNRQEEGGISSSGLLVRTTTEGDENRRKNYWTIEDSLALAI